MDIEPGKSTGIESIIHHETGLCVAVCYMHKYMYIVMCMYVLSSLGAHPHGGKLGGGSVKLSILDLS